MINKLMAFLKFIIKKKGTMSLDGTPTPVHAISAFLSMSMSTTQCLYMLMSLPKCIMH